MQIFFSHHKSTFQIKKETCLKESYKENIIEELDKVDFAGLPFSRENSFEDTDDFRFNEGSVHIKFEDEEDSVNFEV